MAEFFAYWPKNCSQIVSENVSFDFIPAVWPSNRNLIVFKISIGFWKSSEKILESGTII